MARKLKSDRILFTATILLVGLSVVMVYSASAAIAYERAGRASTFLIKQSMWTVLGLALLALVMRIDYRAYREPVFIWSGLAIVTVCLILVLFSPSLLLRSLNGGCTGSTKWAIRLCPSRSSSPCSSG